MNGMKSFQEVARADIRRSAFDLSHDHKTTFNTGDLVPVDIMEVLPGDTFSVDASLLVRSMTPLKPVMDNAFVDLQFYYVPARILWDHWEAMNGQNDASAWAPTVEYTVPQVSAPTSGWDKGSVADHFGIPTGVKGFSINALPFRAYVRIFNDWFRDENLVDPALTVTTDATVTGKRADDVGADPLSDAYRGGKLFRVAKFHDYFTSCLPSPQKGDPVDIPMQLQGTAQVVGPFVLGDQYDFSRVHTSTGTTGNLALEVGEGGYGTPPENLSFPTKGAGGGQPTDYAHVDFSDATGSATINQLREAFALQRILERDARGGSRYTEILRAHFGVVSPDSRLQRPEYLGGKRIRIGMQQVLQTSNSSAGVTPQGNTAAFSLTTDRGSYFTKSFVEHGYIIAVACVRTAHTYQQGVNKLWSRLERFDFYWPALANIGEQPVLNKEIFVQNNVANDQTFGFQEAWAEYRSIPNIVTGELRSNYALTLDSWHYADDFATLPTLSRAFIEETPQNVARTLAVQSQDQFLADFHFKVKAVRPMPLYSTPGLMDHN